MTSDVRAVVAGIAVIAGALALTRGLPRLAAWTEAQRLAALQSARELQIASAAAAGSAGIPERLARLRTYNDSLGSWMIDASSPARASVAQVSALHVAAEIEGIE